LLFAFPHIVWLVLWTVLALLAGIVNWLFTLFAGHPWTPLVRFLSAYIRYGTHVAAFLYVVANPFPGFVGAAGSYPVDVDIPTPGRQNRWITGFKIVLAIPAMFLNSAIGWLVFLGSILIWFYSLVLGRAPRGLQRTGAYAIGYGAQLNCYIYALTDRYPHSSPLAVLRRGGDDLVSPLPSPSPAPSS
jgi:hypothetical protein